MTELKIIHEYNKPNDSSIIQKADPYDKSKICTSKVKMIFHDVKNKFMLQSEKIHVPELDAKW